MSARHRVSKLLLAHGRVYEGTTTWNRTHRLWLGAPALRAGADRAGVHRPARRRRRPDRAQGRARRAPLAARDRRAAVADRRQVAVLSRRRHADRAGAASRARRRLAALRLAAQAVLVARADADASISPASPRPTARSPRPARPTPAGCSSRPPGTTPGPPRIGATLANRQAGQPDHVLQIAWRAQHRLHRLHTRLRERGKPHNVATVAMARELAGFLWAAATAP